MPAFLPWQQSFMHSRQTIRKQVSAVSARRSPKLAVVAALALRIALLWASYHAVGATWKFHALGLEEGRVAWSLANGKGFFGPFPGYETPTAWLAPVYPFLWAICIKLSQLNPALEILLGQILNCLLSAATCWPIYSIGKKIFGGEAGLTSAWLWAILPHSILLPVLWTWDQNLAALALALIVDATLRLRDSGKLLAWTGYGLLWAFAALVNPTLCGVLPFLLGWLVYERRRLGSASLAPYARALAVFVLALLPWTIRNYYSVGGWFFVKSNFGLELWLGNHDPSLTMELHPMNSFPERFRLIFEGEADYNRQKERMALAYIESHPGAFLKKTWGRIQQTWMPASDPEMNGWAAGPHLGRGFLMYCAAFSIVSLAGLILALRDKWMDSLPLAMCLIVFPLPYYITHTGLRYRLPVDTFMAIFTAYALCKAWSVFSTRPATERAQQAQSF
jgi:4-amino-4-deoxy-L-arabinose transferase-like glycosyltransferase